MTWHRRRQSTAIDAKGIRLGVMAEEETSKRTRKSPQERRAEVLDAAVQCYALEGAYPQSLSYLEENYGVQVNHSRFIVSYEAYASNQLPAVAVLEKQTA